MENTNSMTNEKVKKMWLDVKDNITLYFVINILIQTCMNVAVVMRVSIPWYLDCDFKLCMSA